MMRIFSMVIGCGIIALGAYVGGGTDLTCMRAEGSTPAAASAATGSGPDVATCVVRTQRWLGRQMTGEQTYTGVTSADRLPRRSNLQLIADAAPVAEIPASRDATDRAIAGFKQWSESDRRAPFTVAFPDWGFAYAAIGFGAVWLVAVAMIART